MYNFMQFHFYIYLYSTPPPSPTQCLINLKGKIFGVFTVTHAFISYFMLLALQKS